MLSGSHDPSNALEFDGVVELSDLENMDLL